MRFIPALLAAFTGPSSPPDRAPPAPGARVFTEKAAFGITTDTYGGQRMPTTFAPSGTTGSIGAWQAGEREVNASLRGPERFRTYDRMVANVGIIATGIRLALHLIRTLTWTPRPATPALGGASGSDGDPTPEAQRYADLMAPLILSGTETTWADIVAYQAGHVFHDHRVQELRWERRPGGAIGLADAMPRANATIEQWAFDETGRILGAWQRHPVSQQLIAIPRGKMLFTADTSILPDPLGCGILRSIVENVNTRARARDLEAIGMETTLDGFPIGLIPYAQLRKEDAASAAAKAAPMEGLIENKLFSRKRGMTMDSAPYRDSDGKLTNVRQWGIELLRADGRGLADAFAVEARETRTIAIALFVEHLLMGGNDRGAHNLAQDKTERLRAVVNATAADVMQAVHRDITIPTMRLNGWPVEMAPCFTPSELSATDAESAATILESLARAGDALGAPSEDAAPDEIRARIGLPPRPRMTPERAAAMRGMTAPADPGTRPPARAGEEPGRASGAPGKVGAPSGQ